MKLLFLANRTPYPPYRGDKLKIYHLAKRLAAMGHELHLLTFALNKEDLGYDAELKKIFKKVHQVYLPKWKSAVRCLTAAWSRKPVQVLYFQSDEMEETLKEVLAADTFDAVHVQHLRMAPYLAKTPGIPRILDLPDAFSLYWQRRQTASKNIAARGFQRLEQKRLLRYESVIMHYNMALACSMEDIRYLEQKHGLTNLRLLPNGVDLEAFYLWPHDYSHNNTLLFTGNMDYAPNVDAAIFFCKEILPVIREAQPLIQFIIAGQRPVQSITSLREDGVEVTGFVKDIAAMYDRASVVVAPLRFGAGTQNKVLEAMATGVPVVCTEVGFSGLGIEDGEGVFMRKDPTAFAAQILALLSDRDLRERTGKTGAKIAAERFGWDAIARQLEGYLTEVAMRGKPLGHLDDGGRIT